VGVVRRARHGRALTVGGVSVHDLAREFGTPAYILDEADFRARARDFATPTPRCSPTSAAAPTSTTRARPSSAPRWLVDP
jgi:diaminopimelate decarboxylase